MARVLTSEDVVRRIAAECAFVDERGGVGIRLEAAAAIVRQYGEQFRRAARRRQRTPKPTRLIRLAARQMSISGITRTKLHALDRHSFNMHDPIGKLWWATMNGAPGLNRRWTSATVRVGVPPRE
jgi:hypothetical protein